MIEGDLKTAIGRFGVSQDHISRLLERGTMQGVKVGHDWLVQTSSLENYMANRPKPGPKPRSRHDGQPKRE